MNCSMKDIGKTHTSWEYRKLLSITYTRINSWWVQYSNIKKKKNFSSVRRRYNFGMKKTFLNFIWKNGSHEKRYANYNEEVSLAAYIITESKANIKKKQSKKTAKKQHHLTTPGNKGKVSFRLPSNSLEKENKMSEIILALV